MSVAISRLIAASIARVRREHDRFERDFSRAEDIDRFYESRGKTDLPTAKVFAAGLTEWRRSTAGKTVELR